MSKIRVGVVRGGPSSEYEVSLESGGAVLKHLSSPKYSPHDILISKDGIWHMAGIPKEPKDIFKHLDVIFNAMHGEYGEDGKVQQLLEVHGIPFTGSKSLSSALAMNKFLTKNQVKKEGIKTPIYTTVRKGDNVKEESVRIHRSFPQPSIIKPAGAGSSVGVSIARTIAEIETAINKALNYSHVALVEEFIKGREATCGVLDNFRGKDVYPLFPVEIIKPGESDFWDYESKYNGKTQEICPGNFSREESALMQLIAVNVHKALGLRHYSRTDFIVTPKRGIYMLEVNTLPGLTPESLFPKAVQAVGLTFPDLLDHLITLAIQK